MTINSDKWLVLYRTVHFGDTDGAGVMHFHQLFRWCHEAWEESLEHYGISLSEIFPTNSHQKYPPEIALPIIKCEASFRHPIHAGEKLEIRLKPTKIDNSRFQIESTFLINKNVVAIGSIQHLAINQETRKRCEMPQAILLWLEASSINTGPKPI